MVTTDDAVYFTSFIDKCALNRFNIEIKAIREIIFSFQVDVAVFILYFVFFETMHVCVCVFECAWAERTFSKVWLHQQLLFMIVLNNLLFVLLLNLI